MSSLTGVDSAVLAFDSSQSELAIATGDGRVRLFNIAQQRLNADITNELSKSSGGEIATEIYSCMAWGSKGEHSRLLFLGTFTGAVRCYDAARGHVKWNSSSPVDGPIAAVATDNTSLLVVGKTGGAAVLDLATGNVLSRWQASKTTLSAATLMPGGGALVAGSSLTLHDASSGAKLQKWTGHATPVSALAVTADGAYCCSAAKGERCIAVWSTATSANGKLKHKSAVAQLNLDQPAASISIGSAPGGHFHVAAVTASGALRIFEFLGSQGAARQWGSSSTDSGVLGAVITAADGKGTNMVLAVGRTAKPHFQSCRVDQSSSNGEKGAVVEIAEMEAGLLLLKNTGNSQDGKKKGSGVNNDAAVAGADEGVVLAGKNKKRAAEEEDEEEDEDMDVDDNEEGDGPTFAERIAQLQQHDVAPAAAKGEPPSGPLKADSLAVLLSQALQSGDKVLLERCLAVRNEDVITKTVKRLSPSDAAAFLRSAVQRLQSAPARGEQLASWIRAVLLHHSAYLSGVAGAQGTLGYLYQLIEARLASYQPLLSLNGRLDLVLANSRRANADIGDVDADDQLPGANRPLVTVEVDSDGGVEVEDAFAAAMGLSDDDDDDSLDDYESDDYGDEDIEDGDDDEGEESEEF